MDKVNNHGEMQFNYPKTLSDIRQAITPIHSELCDLPRDEIEWLFRVLDTNSDYHLRILKIMVEDILLSYRLIKEPAAESEDDGA